MASSVTRTPSRLLSRTSGARAKWKDRSIVSNCSNANPMDGLDLICYAIASLQGLLELCTEDDADPVSGVHYRDDRHPTSCSRIWTASCRLVLETRTLFWSRLCLPTRWDAAL